MKSVLKEFFRKIGYRIERINPPNVPSRFHDIDEPDFRLIHERVRDYTMIPLERLYSLYRAVRYVSDASIAGAIVECGVWKGGSQMAVAHTLHLMQDTSRDLYLYDTFEGMPEPSPNDRLVFNNMPVHDLWQQYTDRGEKWLVASLEEVRGNMDKTGYPVHRTFFVQGLVENTIPDILPDSIAVLRMDLDLYYPTYHALRHLFPRISRGGVLILDEYGSWKGEQDAVDKYFNEIGVHMLLVRTDDTGGRIGIKVL